MPVMMVPNFAVVIILSLRGKKILLVLSCISDIKGLPLGDPSYCLFAAAEAILEKYGRATFDASVMGDFGTESSFRPRLPVTYCVMASQSELMATQLRLSALSIILFVSF